MTGDGCISGRIHPALLTPGIQVPGVAEWDYTIGKVWPTTGARLSGLSTGPVVALGHQPDVAIWMGSSQVAWGHCRASQRACLARTFEDFTVCGMGANTSSSVQSSIPCISKILSKLSKQEEVALPCLFLSNTSSEANVHRFIA